MSFSGRAFGRFISRKHRLFSLHVCEGLTVILFSGESRTIIIFRGVLGALLIVAIPIFSVVVLVIEPVYETGAVTPFKGLKLHSLFPSDFRPSDQPVWNVIIVSYTLYYVYLFQQFFIDEEEVVG
jgi:hypothetical protein